MDPTTVRQFLKPSPLQPPPPRKDVLYHRISMMMYGFGDSHEPNPETVRLVENIVLTQLRMIIREALKYASDENEVKAENLVFLLRHNKYKMQRFVRYLHMKDLNKRVKSLSTDVINVSPDEPPKNSIIEFIEKIDETGEFLDTSEIDEVKFERMLRADLMTQEMNEERYVAFQKARCASFRGAGNSVGLENLRHWVDPKEELILKPEAVDVLCYFASQTVAEIMDYALMIREDSKSGADPVSHLPGSYYTATMFNNRYRFIKANQSQNMERKIDYSGVRSGQPAITPNEIKEVMRRVYTPQAGKLNFGGKVPDTHYIFAL